MMTRLGGDGMTQALSGARAIEMKPEIASAIPKGKWLTLLAACSGLIMLYVDLFIVNVALPSIGRDFQAPASLSAWTIVSYALMIGVFPMGVGRLADLLGQRRVY